MPPESERDECNSLEMAARGEAYEAAATDAAMWREVALALAIPFAVECEERPPESRWVMSCGLGKPLLTGPTQESVVLAWWNQRHTQQPKEPT